MNKNLEELKILAKEVVLKTGKHYPQLFAYTEKGMITSLFVDFPNTHEKKVELFLNTGVKLAEGKGAGKLEEVYFITEGWMATVDKKEIMVRPSEHPKRKEVLIVLGRILDEDKTVLAQFEMVRNEKEEVVELKDMGTFESKIKSPLLDAFLFGYTKTQERISVKQN